MSGSDLTDAPLTLVEILHTRAAQQPEQLAYTFLTDGEQTAVHLTYAELDWRARAIATHLSTLCPPGEPVLLLYAPGLDYIAALFACWYAGAIAVPTYPPQPNRAGDRLYTVLEDAQPRLVLTNREMYERVKGARGQGVKEPRSQGAKGSGGQGVSVEVEEARFEMEGWGFSLPCLLTDEIVGWEGDRLVPSFSPTLPSPPSPSAPALLQYTSGSTATPKGVVLTHSNLIANLHIIQQQFGHTPQSRGVIWLPPYHDMGLVGGILQPLFVGFPVVLFSPWLFVQRPMRWLQAISRCSATTSGAPNFAYDLCVRRFRQKDAVGLDLSSWEVAFNGAEPIRAETMERFAQTFAPYRFRRQAFYPCYGMAEATLMISGGRWQFEPVPSASTSPNTPVSCGTPSTQTKVLIVDPEARSPVPVGTVGEIWVAGNSVAAGYWQRPAETEATFAAHLATDASQTFLRTGDLGYWQGDPAQENLVLVITGRQKDLMIIRGRNHYPQDIEQTVQASHPDLVMNGGAAFEIEIAGIVTLGIAQEVERRAIASLDTDAVFRAIAQSVTTQHEIQVGAIALLKPGGLPKTLSGKVQRQLCRGQLVTEAAELSPRLGVIATWQNPALLEAESTSEEILPENSSTAASTATETTETTEKQYSEAEIEAWLVTHLADYLHIPADSVDVAAPFADYGLDSSVAVSLTGELAEWLGVAELEPMLFWEFPSIEALAEHLGDREL